jgi:hypothetical protein
MHEALAVRVNGIMEETELALTEADREKQANIRFILKQELT